MNQNILRHKILCILAEKCIDNIEELTPKGITQIPIVINEYKEATLLSLIASDLKVTESEIKKACIPLFNNNEIKYINLSKGKGMLIDKNGLVAYSNEIYKKAFDAEKKLSLDISNAEKISKTYWITFWIALVGFLISVFLLILKLREL